MPSGERVERWRERIDAATPFRYGLRRVDAGRYVHRSGDLIVKTDGWDGPRGGTYSLWEQAYVDSYGSVVVGDKLITGRTLRAAAGELDRYHAEDGAS
jgi:hypothetical protein